MPRAALAAALATLVHLNVETTHFLAYAAHLPLTTKPTLCLSVMSVLHLSHLAAISAY